MKYIYLIGVVFFFNACSATNYNSITNYIDLKKERKQFTNSTCSFNSFIINSQTPKYGKIFIEHVELNNNCEWNGFSRSYFDNLFKEKTHVKSMVAVERVDFENFEFSTYLINDKYILNLISEFSGSKSVFTLDYKGLLFNEMIKKFDKNYVSVYLEKPRFSSNYNSSLVNQNIVKDYFNKEIEEL